jgi:hypothetical protein
MSFSLNEEAILGALRKLKPNNVSGPHLIPVFLMSDCVESFENPYVFCLICFFNLIFFLMPGKSLKLYPYSKRGIFMTLKISD